MKDTIEYLSNFSLEYKDIIDELKFKMNSIDKLDQVEFEELKNEINHLYNIASKINIKNKVISSKVYTIRALKDPNIKSKLNDKDSIEYNEVLLNQGKAARSLDNIEKSAKAGDVDAQYYIGKTYLYGVLGYYNEIKMKDVGKGLKWLTVAYKNGSLESGFLIANYEQSVLNMNAAIKLYEILGDKNHLPSLKELLLIYKKDDENKNTEKYFKIKDKINKL